jgi:hypothetical protein
LDSCTLAGTGLNILTVVTRHVITDNETLGI